MTNTPITEQDIRHWATAKYDLDWVPIEKVQSAKRLLKSKISKMIPDWSDVGKHVNKQIDACFQIPDGDGKKGDDKHG